MRNDYYTHGHSVMNVIYLDDDPKLSAQQYCDIDVGSQIANVARLLSSAWSLEKEAEELYALDWAVPRGDNQQLYNELKYLRAEVCGNQVYRPQMTDHPCVAWARTYGGNYDWLYQLGCELMDEYTLRFDRVHSASIVIRALEVPPPSLLDSLDKYCESPAVMPHELMKDGAVESYRNYYRQIMHRALRYTRRRPPEWITDISTFLKEQL